MNMNGLQPLKKITMCHEKKECSNALLPFLVQIEGLTVNGIIDGIIKETLSEIACSLQV